MFAPLDPTSRRLRLPYEQEVIINDTVGFIRDLPEALVAAFRATLEEISDSDLLVHVVDVANPRAVHQIGSVEKILSDLGLGGIPQVIALNKSDLVAPDDIEAVKREVARTRGQDTPCRARRRHRWRRVSCIGPCRAGGSAQRPSPGRETSRRRQE